MKDKVRQIGSICLGHRARVAARAITRHYNAHLKPLDLTAGQFSVLVALEDTAGLSMHELAELLAVDSTTLVRGLQQLQLRGLIDFEGGRGPKGKRPKLTKAGQALLKRAIPRWEKAYTSLVEALGGRMQAGRAVSTLRKLAESATRASGLLRD